MKGNSYGFTATSMPMSKIRSILDSLPAFSTNAKKTQVHDPRRDSSCGLRQGILQGKSMKVRRA